MKHGKHMKKVKHVKQMKHEMHVKYMKDIKHGKHTHQMWCQKIFLDSKMNLTKQT